MSKNEAELRKVLVHLNEYVADEDMPTIRDLITSYAERQSLLARKDERQEVVYEIMRGQHGHDERVIVKSLQENIDAQLNTLEKGEEYMNRSTTNQSERGE